MFDLNLTMDCNVNHNTEAPNSTGPSPETSLSSILNAGDGQSASSSNEDTSSTEPTITLNFEILKRADHDGDCGQVEVKDDRDQGILTLAHSGLVTRELFPGTSRLAEMNSANRHNAQQDRHHLQQQQVQQARKSRRGPRSRSSQYRGVTFYRRTGRWESHIWDCGKQVYLGGFDTALAAARAYDRAAVKFRGVDADINFNLADYEEDLKQMKNLSKEEFVQILRRQSNGFSRGSSKYRGVTLHKCGRWEAPMGQFLGKKAYDKAAIECNGTDAVTNFGPSSYDGKMVKEPHNEGSKHNLDLNLGISTSSPTKVNGSLGSFHFHPYDTQNPRLLKVENTSMTRVDNAPLRVPPVTPEQPAFWAGENSKFASHSAEPAAQLRTALVVPQQEPANWRWPTQGKVCTAPNATSFTAASSRFWSPPATIALPGSASSRPLTIDLCFSSYPNTSSDSSLHFKPSPLPP